MILAYFILAVAFAGFLMYVDREPLVDALMFGFAWPIIVLIYLAYEVTLILRRSK